MAPQAPQQVRPGSLEEAIANGRKLLKVDPKLAITQAQAILRRDPANADAFRLAAAGQRLLGEDSLAEQAEMEAIQCSEHVPALRAAARALNDKQPGEASRIAAEHLRQTPDDLVAWTLSAESALALDLPDKAEPLLRQVLQRAPRFAPANALLVSALLRQDKLQEARERLEALAATGKADAVDQRLLARVQFDIGDLEAAAGSYERLLDADDSSAEIWTGYGDALRFLGRKTESALAYRRAIALDPTAGQPWWSLVDLDLANVGEEDVESMQAALSQRAGQPDHEANLHFALGAVFDARKDHARAFEHFDAGNAFRRAAQPYDANELTRHVDRSIERLVPSVLAARQSVNRGTAGIPIFIVGMPRSGSTLVERMLGQHSAVEALGELPVVSRIVDVMRANDRDTEIADQVASLDREDLRRHAEHYLARARERRRTDRRYFTDKMHMNWQHLPLILRMLPEARVLDVRRSAMDCCWSNYKVLFAGGHPAASDFAALAGFYRDYVRMMEAIDRNASGRVLRVDYERLVEEPEAQVRSMLGYLGLEFEPGCLEFHRSNAPVTTASSEQVRKPLNREGIGAWKPYAPWLGPLREALGPLAED